MSPGYWRRGRSGWSWLETKEGVFWPETGYEFSQAQGIFIEGLLKAKEYYLNLPKSSVASGFVLIELVRHPARQKAINFPAALMKALKFSPMEILKGLVTPRSTFVDREPEPQITQRILVSVRRRMIGRSLVKAAGILPQSREGLELCCLEKIRLYDPGRSLNSFLAKNPALPENGQFTASLYRIPDLNKYPDLGFASLAKKLGFTLCSDWHKGRIVSVAGLPKSNLLAVNLEGPWQGLGELAKFSLLESIKPFNQEKMGLAGGDDQRVPGYKVRKKK
jgi:hypothetical protein